MKKLITMCLLFGFISVNSFADPAASKVGEKADVDCTKIFEGGAAKDVSGEGKQTPAAKKQGQK